MVQLSGGTVAQNYVGKSGAGASAIDEDHAAQDSDDGRVGGKPVVHVALAIEVGTPLALCDCQVACYGLRERSTDGGHCFYTCSSDFIFNGLVFLPDF